MEVMWFFFLFFFSQQKEHWKNKQMSDLEFVMKAKPVSSVSFPVRAFYTFTYQHVPIEEPNQRLL